MEPVEIPTGYVPGPWEIDLTEGVQIWADAGDECGGMFQIAEFEGSEWGLAQASLAVLAPAMAAELLALRAEVARLTATLEAEREGLGRARRAALDEAIEVARAERERRMNDHGNASLLSSGFGSASAILTTLKLLQAPEAAS